MGSVCRGEPREQAGLTESCNANGGLGADTGRRRAGGQHPAGVHSPETGQEATSGGSRFQVETAAVGIEVFINYAHRLRSRDLREQQQEKRYVLARPYVRADPHGRYPERCLRGHPKTPHHCCPDCSMPAWTSCPWRQKQPLCAAPETCMGCPQVISRAGSVGSLPALEISPCPPCLTVGPLCSFSWDVGTPTLHGNPVPIWVTVCMGTGRRWSSALASKLQQPRAVP